MHKHGEENGKCNYRQILFWSSVTATWQLQIIRIILTNFITQQWQHTHYSSRRLCRWQYKSEWSIRVAAPTHFMRDVKQFCDCHYPEEWVGRNVLVLWPPRSSDLTPVGPSRDTVYWKTVNMRNEFGVWLKLLWQEYVWNCRGSRELVASQGSVVQTWASSAKHLSILRRCVEMWTMT